VRTKTLRADGKIARFELARSCLGRSRALFLAADFSAEDFFALVLLAEDFFAVACSLTISSNPRGPPRAAER
jgi:hypothetical protein